MFCISQEKAGGKRSDLFLRPTNPRRAIFERKRRFVAFVFRSEYQKPAMTPAGWLPEMGAVTAFS
jgi:hypothetical protein